MKLKLKAIIVDNEVNILEEIRRYCEAVPYVEVLGAFLSPTEAFDFACRNKPDIAIMDIEMPEIKGVTLARMLQKINSYVQIVFITGYEDYALQAYNLSAIAYLLKPIVPETLRMVLDKAAVLVWAESERNTAKKVRVSTFGHFDVYVNDEALFFNYTKSKELFAYLVNANGGIVTMEQVVDILWEDRPYDLKIKQLYRKAVGIMRETFNKAEIEDICFYYRGSLAANVKRFSCDYYQFLDGDEEARKLYNGNYLTEYYWAEEINGVLSNILGNKK